MTREDIENSMTLKDAIEVFKCTNAYGSMDIAKTVILTALEQDPIIYKIIAEIDKQDEWLTQAGYNAYNVHLAFKSIIRVAECQLLKQNIWETHEAESEVK